MPADRLQSDEGGLAAALRSIRELLEASRFAPALALARKWQPGAPRNRDLLYMIAVAERYLGCQPQALATLAELERHHPGYARLFQERGHCYVALRAVSPAIAAFSRAVTLNASLPASWRALEALHRVNGDAAGAAGAASRLAALAALPPALITAFSMFADGETADAETLVRSFLRDHGEHVEALRLLAQIAARSEVLDDAEALLSRVLSLAPGYAAARYELALILLRRRKHRCARQELEGLLQAEPANPVYRSAHAAVCAEMGDLPTALAGYSSLIAERPDDGELLTAMGHALRTAGRAEEAAARYRTAAASPGLCSAAWWGLAELKTYRFTEAEIRAMRRHEAADGLPLADRYRLCFALGKALEDRAEFEEAFQHYRKGNALKRTEISHLPSPFDHNLRAQAEVCTREFFAARGRLGLPDRSPIFIVGMPRAGSTLIEQILASHSAVEGTSELAEILRIVQEMKRGAGAGAPYPRLLAELAPSDVSRLATQYLEDTRAYRTGRPHFIDKMPGNFRHLGLIHLLLPGAKIIDARRSAMACCVSNFTQLYDSGHLFAYDLDDLGRYYRTYLEHMAHWDLVLPGRVLQVRHEELVEDLEGTVRRILEHCELGFEPACLNYHRTARAVHTASAQQVRQPINRAALDHWRHFEPWLSPLRAALGDAAGP